MDEQSMVALGYFITRQIRGFAVLYAIRLVVDAVEDATKPKAVSWSFDFEDYVYPDGSFYQDESHFKWNRCEFWNAALLVKVSLLYWL